MPELTPLAPGVMAWLADAPDLAHPNAGVVLDDDGITVIDTLCHPIQAKPFAESLAPLERPIRRAVLTSSHVQYVGGSSAFPLAAVYGTAQISADLELAPNTGGYQRLMPAEAAAFEELTTRPVTHVVTEAAYVSAAAIAVPTTGQIDQNVVVQVPSANVVFGGAMCWFGVTPPAFAGNPAAWADALDTIAGYADIFIPGHGAIGGVEEVRELQAYLRAVVAAEGDPGRLQPGPWDRWSESRFHPVNVERAAKLAEGDASPPSSMLELLGLA